MAERGSGARTVIGLTTAVALTGIALSAGAATALTRQQDRAAEQQLDRQARQAREAVAAECGRYVDALRTTAAAAGAFNELTADKFTGITAPLALTGLAGVTSVAFIVPTPASGIPAVQASWRARGATGLVLRPVGTAAEHLFSVFTTALDGSPAPRAGIDLSQARAPTAALNEARRSGQPTASDAYQLLADAHLPANRRQMSFVLAAPVYGRAASPGGRTFRGWVLMGLRGQSFAAATLQRASQQLMDIHLLAFNSNQEQVSVATLTAPVEGERDLRRDLSVPVAERRWQLHITARAERLPGADSHLPATVGVGGTALSLLMAALVAVLATGRRRAQAQIVAATAGLAAAETTARKQADLLDAVLNSISDGVSVVDERGEFILYNPAAKAILGLDSDRGGVANWQKRYGMFRPDGTSPFPVAEMPLVRALAGESITAVEMVIRNAGQPDGVTISVSARPLDSGGAIGAVAVFHDITHHKAAQAQLAANAEALRQELAWRQATEMELRQTRDDLASQQAYLTQVLDALEPTVITCDTDGVIVHANHAARLAGATTDRPTTVAERAAALDFRHPDGAPVTLAELPLLRSLRGEQVDRMEVVAHGPDGSAHVTLIHSRPLRHADGHITGAVASIYDITELRERENELRAFAGVVAHDLKSPLSAIAGYAELLDDELGDEPGPAHLRPMLGRIRASVERMRTLIEDLLAYATARDAALDPQPVDLNAVVAAVLTERTAHLRSTSGDTGAPFPDIYTGPLPVVQADPGMVRQLFDNLIGNALKYTAPGQPARIDISATRRDDRLWTVQIADRGIGIPAEDQPHIFTSFHRAAAHKGYQGTGLGLAICERIVTRHGGTITASDNPGGGTRIRFTLPGEHPAPEATPPAAPEHPQSHPTRPAGR
ncbi:ATP-binding protein, partial [Actinoplanes teichomyceticus]